MKSLLALALALVATSAVAQVPARDWRKISETQDGKALLVDVKSADFSPHNGVNYAGALFQYVPGDGIFAFVLESDACIKGQGPIYYRIKENNQWVTKQNYWFTLKGGTRMYDHAAQVLCAAHLDIQKQKNKSVPDESESAV